jgi:cytochrome P450
MMRGRYVHSIRDFHLRYGNVVRVAPDELSFADPSAWADIHHRHNTEKTFLKNPIFMAKPESHPVESIPTTTNVADHTRQRRVLEKSFGSGAIKLQEPIVQENISLLIARLREDIEKSRLTKGGQKEALVNMTDWYSFCTFDILGDLAFGEPFGCLQSGAYHKWVEIGTNNIKGLTRQTALKYYPTLYWIVERLLPKSLKEKERYHYAHTVEKVDKRMSLERKRDDFMTPVLKTKGRPEGMSKEEIYCNFGFLIIAGSETTTITLSGITNYLVQSPDVLDKLEREIRSHFSDDMEITSDTIKNLPYLDAVIKEGLRLCTAVPAGNSRIVPPGGATICGEYIPEKVCQHHNL